MLLYLNFSTQTMRLLLNVCGCISLFLLFCFLELAVMEIQPKALHIRVLL